LAFFAGELAAGRQTIQTIAINILDGAQGTDKEIADRKIAAADAFTTAMDTTAEQLAYTGNAAAALGVAFLKTVTTTAPSAAAVDAAVAGVVTAADSGTSGTAGSTLTLAVGGDTIDPAQTDFAKKSTANDDTIRGDTATNTLETIDVIDAGGGVDTLNADLSGAGTSKPVLKSVEIVNAMATGGTPTLDLGDSTGVQQAWNNGSTGALTVQGLGVATTVGLKGTIAAASTFTFNSVGGTSDSATLAVQEALVVGSTVTIAGIETLNIAVSDNAATVGNISTIDSLVAVNAKTVMVTGEVGTLTVGGAAAQNLSALTKFDASGLKGNMVLDLGTGANDPTGAVEIYASNNGTNTITMGGTAGTADKLVFTSANVSTINKLTTVGASWDAANDKLDVKAFALGADTTVGSSAVTPAGDIAGYFSGTDRVIVDTNTPGMVYVDINKDGNFNAGTDLAVMLTGTTAANFTTADLILA
jgi:hypothetical protein